MKLPSPAPKISITKNPPIKRPRHDIQSIQLLSQDQSHIVLWLHCFLWWFSMFQLNHNTLVNKYRQKDGQGHLPFSNEKLLLLPFSFCSLGTLDLQSSISDPSTRSNHGQTYKANKKIYLRTLHHNKRKALKERTKGYGSLLRLRKRKKHRKRN